MGVSPNTAAFVAALCFGVVVFPWKSTVTTLGQPGVFVFVGGTYLLTGLLMVASGGFTTRPTVSSVGIALLTALMYVAALVCCNYAFGHPSVNLPIAAAITAAYPLITAAITVLLMGQRFTFRETVFFLMAVIGVSGLGLSSK